MQDCMSGGAQAIGNLNLLGIISGAYTPSHYRLSRAPFFLFQNFSQNSKGWGNRGTAHVAHAAGLWVFTPDLECPSFSSFKKKTPYQANLSVRWKNSQSQPLLSIIPTIKPHQRFDIFPILARHISSPVITHLSIHMITYIISSSNRQIESPRETG